MRWALRLAMRVAALDRILPRLMQSLNTPLRHIILGGQPCYTCLVCKSGMLPFLKFAQTADDVTVPWILLAFFEFAHMPGNRWTSG